jgi:hypothetical protein
MDDRIATAHGSFGRGGVADVAFNELIARMMGNGVEIREVAGVGKLVVVDDGVIIFAPEDISTEI